MSSELIYRIALTMVNNIGSVTAKKLIDHFYTATAIFKANKKELYESGMPKDVVESIKDFKDFSKAEKNVEFIEQNNIEPIFITEKNYPQRLLNCFDPPVLLYYKGNADLNHQRIVSIVGTRNNTNYGKKITEDIIASLASQNIIIVSGLAYGIDTIAHKTALDKGLQTIGVLANGLKTIYPAQNKKLSDTMRTQGGILSELPHDAAPDRFNFPRRNRIVAGMADAIIVIETSKKGGSMITAEIANSYSREIFAIPGRVDDSKSEGCNYLIQSNKAQIFTDVEQFLFAMNWNNSKQYPKQQQILFHDPSLAEQKIIDILRMQGSLHIDELQSKSKLNASELSGALLSLELAGIVEVLPGKIYKFN
ncbi:MAG: DNA-processing protein DprA [Arachidicoccus sp.]|nr:DNA-processing protein DprA [Arachidicoccus sp.]